MKLFITYGDEKYKESREYSVRKALKLGGFDKAIAYNETDIDPAFREANKHILSYPLGGGLWLWKPYVILKALNQVDDGDYVFYLDAGAFFIRKVDYIIATMDHDIWVSDIPLVEWQFTKKDAFVLMGCDDSYYRDTPQIQATFICIRKSAFSVAFINEWLRYCTQQNIIAPEVTNPGLNNPQGFVDHRHDQSVLSLLCKKHRIPTHLDPTFLHKYFSFPPNYVLVNPRHKKEYPIIIFHHRLKKPDWRVFLKLYGHIILPEFILNKYVHNSLRDIKK